MRALSSLKLCRPAYVSVPGALCADALQLTVAEPANLDNDGDGMMNAWERRYGLNPEDPTDLDGDTDGDGLLHREEYQAGSDPWLRDSDGDGASDGMEVHDTGTDPTTPDVTGIVTVASVNGASATNVLGQWATNGAALYAKSRRGSVSYALHVPTSNLYRLEIEGCAHEPFMAVNVFDLLLSVDEDDLGREVLRTVGTSNAIAQVMTPWLPQGWHTVRIYWDNAADFRSLQVNALRLQTLLGPDTNGNGRNDWVDRWLARQCGVEVAPLESVVSPVCIEGRSPYLSGMSVSGAAVRPGAGKRWYADVPLSQGNSTPIVTSFQNGGLVVTNAIAWVPLNLLDTNERLIRKGDSLKLTAFPRGATNGVVTITIGGVTSRVTTLDTPVVHPFNTPGVFTITGVFDNGDVILSKNIDVKVVSAEFNGSPACWVGRVREWDCPRIPEEVVIENDSAMLVEDLGATTKGARKFRLKVNAAETAYVVARLGRDGPILAHEAIRGFDVHTTVDSYVRIAETYENGDQIIETLVVETPILDEVILRLDLMVGGLVFEDGSGVHEVAASNLNELGEHKVRLIRPASAQTSICHTLKAYQGGAYVGMR